MMLTQISTYIEELIFNMGVFAPVLACVFIVVESILPVLPLCTFITVNFIAFGSLFGFLISWFFTCVGCYTSYRLVNKGFYLWRQKHPKSQKNLDNYIKKINNVSFSSLCLIMAVPFTPAFIINIAAGIANMSKRKFILAIFLGKMFMVYFWGFIGKGLLESLENPIILVRVSIMLLIAYALSLLVKKFMNE